jgi:hypothetical protein
VKHKVPFGTACGHRRWSREGKKLAELRSTLKSRRSQLGASRLFITRIAICEIVMRSGPSDHRRSRPLIRLNEVYEFVKYEAPFGTACGHSRWSCEGKKLAVLSSVSESQRSRLGVSRSYITGMTRCKITKLKLCLALGHSQWAYELNTRPYELHPIVQLNLSMIEGLLFLFTVNRSVVIQLLKQSLEVHSVTSRNH